MMYIASIMLAWVRADIAIAKAAPVWNINHIELLRRKEACLEKVCGK